MTNYEWKVNFEVEGRLPKTLPKPITKECILKRGKKGNTALLSITIYREPVPSSKEVTLIKKIALEKANKIVDFYSLFFGRLRLVNEFPESVEQITPYNGPKMMTASLRLDIPGVVSDESFKKRMKLLKDIDIHSLEDFLYLALSHYQLSVWKEPMKRLNKVSFLNSMICIEALYNTGAQEIRKTTSHRIANLFGRTNNTRAIIYNQIYELYKKRNNLVHGSKSVVISFRDLWMINKYSKYSLLAFLKMKVKNKSDFTKKLDKSIYSEEVRQENQEKIIEIIVELEQILKLSS